jgi:PAS domain S-box-containing protein
MEAAFPLFLEEYERSGGNPAYMDLEPVKKEIGGEMELYVIDDSATIIATTYTPELGLNFSEFDPSFADYLGTIRRSSGFFPNRVGSQKSTGNMEKFSFMPTPDHRYILELGLEKVDPTFPSYQYSDEDIIRQVEQSNPYLVDVRVFDATLRQRINDTAIEVSDPVLKDLLAGILLNRTTLDIADHKEGSPSRYLFIELRDKRYDSDVSRIIELTYTERPIRRALASSALYDLSFGVIALLSCGFLAILTIWTLTRPIGMMMDDVDKIAEGDLDHTITRPFGYELSMLGESITRMIERLKDLIVQRELSEKRFADLVQLLPQGIFETDIKGNITFANPVALHFFGLLPEDLGHELSIFNMIVPENRTLAEEQFQRILQGMKTEGTELTGLRKDGSTFPVVVYTAANIRDGEVLGARGTVVDITRLKHVEAELRNLNIELENRVADRTRQLTEANKNLESFTYTVSHDLRAPLRAISGYSSIIMQDLKDIPDKDRKYLELLRQNAHDMGRLIDDLLNLSKLRMHSLAKETVQPATIVKNILREIRTDPSMKNVEFKVEELPSCQADPGLLKQVYVNLISNALKFSRKRDLPIVEIGSLTKDGVLTYFVRDNGIGFDMRYTDKIFGVFQKLHDVEEYEGTGIGLAIVQRIIEMHGGRIWVESNVDEGTTFYFTCS